MGCRAPGIFGKDGLDGFGGGTHTVLLDEFGYRRDAFRDNNHADKEIAQNAYGNAEKYDQYDDY